MAKDDQKADTPTPSAGTTPRFFGFGEQQGAGGFNYATFNSAQFNETPYRVYEETITEAVITSNEAIASTSPRFITSGIPETGIYTFEITKDNVVDKLQERITLLERSMLAISMSLSVYPIGHNNPPEPIGGETLLTAADLTEIREQLSIIKLAIVNKSPSDCAEDAINKLESLREKIVSIFGGLTYDLFSSYVKQVGTRAGDATIFLVLGLITLKAFSADLTTLVQIGQAWLQYAIH